MDRTFELTAADGLKFPVFEACPSGQPKGAVVVLQEIFGVNAHIRATAQRFAAHGFVALAPALFHRIKPAVELGYEPQDVAAGLALKAAVQALPEPGVMQDIEATVAHARSLGKVAVVGYCWGGLLAWRAACALANLDVAVPYYGGGMTAAEERARRPRCPVMAHFARDDASIPIEGVQAFEQAQPQVQIHVYPASHGFNCDHRAAYQPAAASLARERTFAFLDQHLG